MDQRRMMIDDLLRLRLVADPQVSPDGTRVACAVMTVAPPPAAGERPEYVSHLYVLPSEGGTPTRFTEGRQRDAAPRWSPDGTRLVFISDRDRDRSGAQDGDRPKGKRPRHLWSIAATGGEARRLTVAEHDPSDPVWSPDGQWVAFVGKVPKARRAGGDVPPADHPSPDGASTVDETRWEGEEASSDVKVITRLRHKFDGEGFWDGRFKHIFVVPADGGEARQITSGDFHHLDPAWSPDGRQLAFAANRTEEADFTNAADLWVVDVADGIATREPRQIIRSSGPCGLPSWSPDGARLAYIGHDNAYMTATSAQLWVVDVNGGEPRTLTQAFDRVVGHHVLTDMRAHPVPGRPAWSPDGGTLYCLIGTGGTCQLAAIDAEQGEVRLLTQDDHEAFQFSFDGARQRCVVALSDPQTPGDLWLASLGSDGRALEGWRRLTDFNGGVLSGVALSRMERFASEGADEWPVEGWVMRPADFRPGQRYPTILQIHGGPHAAYGYGFFHEFQLLAAEGFALVFVNPRGSQGYGQRFAAATRHDWGGKDFEDIMRGLDAALARFPFLDPARLGVAGGSYGGYMTNWVIGHSDRFKAAVTMRSIANCLSQWGMSDLAFMKGFWEFPGDPWENPTFYWERSPLSYAARITTPLLIIHSEQDLRCPVGEGEQLFAALRKQRKEVVFLRFPEESHDLSRKGRPDHRVERLRWIVRWFADHLGREAVPIPAREETVAAD